MKSIYLSVLLLLMINIPTQAFQTPHYTDWDMMWQIQLLNRDNLIYEDVIMEEIMTFDEEIVDARAGIYYQAMSEAAALEGHTLYLYSGYRSIATQQQSYDEGVQRYMSYGYNYETAVAIASGYYALPGGSEHNIGLAFDIITPQFLSTMTVLNDTFANTSAYQWLFEHCSDYGFIIRYPKERTEDTGINFEPWHYRYVGVEHAKYMKENNLILEEYVALYQETYPELYSDTVPDVPDHSVSTTVPEYSFDYPKIQRFQEALHQFFPYFIPPFA